MADYLWIEINISILNKYKLDMKTDLCLQLCHGRWLFPSLCAHELGVSNDKF